mgnify:FL=1
MADRKPVEATNLDRYGAPIIPWSDVRDALDRLHEADVPFFLGTVYPDGHPHIAGFGPAWLDGDFYICTGLATQKAKNIAANPACTIAAHLPGYDVTMEGTATRVDHPETLEKVAAVYREGGWPAEVSGDALVAPYSAPSAGPPPWHIFQFTFDKVVALKLDEQGGATRWRFA